MTDSVKAISWSGNLFPFGEINSETAGPLLNDHRFLGQFHDRTTNLHYNMFRHYNPAIGQYITPDPIGVAGGLNLYSYTSQNPINRIDPWGLTDYTCLETLAKIREAGDQNIFQALWNHSGRGDYDFLHNEEFSTFIVAGRTLDAGQFGNYLAGYVGYKNWGTIGFNAVRFGGIYYDAKDNLLPSLPGDDRRKRDPGKFDWDADSFPDIVDGGLRAILEDQGIKIDQCPCE